MMAAIKYKRGPIESFNAVDNRGGAADRTREAAWRDQTVVWLSDWRCAEREVGRGGRERGEGERGGREGQT